VAKIPPDAFEYYVSLGLQRSYQAVADRYCVSKRAITKKAAAEQWKERLLKIERAARERVDGKMTESLEAVNARHLQMVRFIQGKALAALKAMPLTSGMDAARALDAAIKQERVILGEPGDRSAVSVEEIIKREYARWMRPAGAEGEGDDIADAPE
jgi:hypothetical protein